jgi:hypothetical protein
MRGARCDVRKALAALKMRRRGARCDVRKALAALKMQRPITKGAYEAAEDEHVGANVNMNVRVQCESKSIFAIRFSCAP